MLMISNIPYPKIRDTRILGLVAFLIIVIMLLFYLDYQAGLDILAKASFVLMGLYVFSPFIYK
jgi:phosphatidylserine synthase